MASKSKKKQNLYINQEINSSVLACSERGKCLSSLIASERASTLQGDSLINSEIGKEIEI